MACWLTIRATSARGYPVPPGPEEVLKTADAVIIGIMSNAGDVWRLKVIRALKGDWTEGQQVVVYPSSETFEEMVREGSTQPLLFCGGYDPVTGVLLPVFEMSSIMPGGVPEELLPIRSLWETVRYAEGILGLPETKGTPPATWKERAFGPRLFVPVAVPMVVPPEKQDAMEAADQERAREEEIADQRIREEWLADRRERMRSRNAANRWRPSSKSFLTTSFGQGVLAGLALGPAVALLLWLRLRVGPVRL